MKRFAIGIFSAAAVLAVANSGFAKDLTTTGIEEAFVDATGVCAASSNVNGALAKCSDPAVKAALRDALIIEAADDAAGVAGTGGAHSDCMKKELQSRGMNANQVSVLPYCVKHDSPDPFTSLGVCVKNHSRLEGALHK
ncbi:MAG TPA: hypothetical protein VMU16_04055 [Candidatus Binataceae bacterium]|nr:hypothetical protein [Candidatus Binataceae bacterium]